MPEPAPGRARDAGPSTAQHPPVDVLTVVTGVEGPWPTRVAVSADRAWTVGRADEADIVVPGELVSRRHLVLEPDAPDWVVRDVSANGSWHDGTRVDQAGLRVPPGTGIRLRLGDRTGPEIHLERAPEPAAAAVPAAVATGAPAAAVAAAVPATARTRVRRRHRYRRLGVVLAVLIVVLVIADRVAARVASTQAVSQLVQKSQGLVHQPHVEFGGFPFLTQVAFGDYTDIRVRATDVRPPHSIRLDSVDAHLRGAHVPLSAVIHSSVSRIPVDRIDATVALRFADLNPYLAHQPGHLTLSGRHGAVHVSGTFVQDGDRITVSGAVRIGVDDGDLVVTPVSMHISGGGDLAEIGSAVDAAGDLLSGPLSVFPPVPIPLPGLPFHLRLTGARSDDNGISASASVQHIVLATG